MRGGRPGCPPLVLPPSIEPTMMSPSRVRSFCNLSSLRILLTLGLPACDSVLDPKAETEMVFSIFGHLDVAADTQWVRVAPFRGSIFSTPDPIDAAVTIEDLGTGRTIEMVSAPFSQESPNFGDTLYAYNFFSTEPIYPESVYRLTVRRSDGGSSSATVRTPPAFPDLLSVIGIAQSPTQAFQDYIRFHIPPGAHLAMVQTRQIGHTIDQTLGDCVAYRYNFFPAPPPLEQGGDIQVNLYPVLFRLPQGCFFDREEVRIVLAGDPWLPDTGADETHINALDNIENGVGFLAGVITKSIPYEDCTITGANRPSFCELFYGSAAATLIVRPIDGGPVRLPGVLPIFQPTTRVAKGNDLWARGGNRIHALEPGEYNIRITNPTDYYCEDRRILLGHGEVRTIEVVMVPRSAFPNEPVNANGCREG